MSTAYSLAELEAMGQALIARRPPPMTEAQFYHARKVTSFAVFGDGRGVAVRVRTDEKTVQNFALNPEVARYLAAAIIGVGLTAAWTVGGKPLHPAAVPLGLSNPDPEAEKRWEKDLSRERVVPPDQGTFDKAPKVVAIDGHGSLDEFAVSLALATGSTVHLRMNPLLAWKLSREITDIAEAEVWWDDDGTMVPGRGLN